MVTVSNSYYGGDSADCSESGDCSDSSISSVGNVKTLFCHF